MIKIKDYYSDVVLEGDENNKVKCCWCEKIFPTLEILLNVKDDEDEDPDEHCPFCKTKGHLMDLGDE
jgi:uncharacterized Zn-finger protein